MLIGDCGKMYLYHYFDRIVGPFKNISDLSPKEAKMVLDNIKKNKPNSQCAGRHDKYGFPQDWNDDGKYGPERYIEAHIWSDKIIDKYVAIYNELNN